MVEATRTSGLMEYVGWSYLIVLVFGGFLTDDPWFYLFAIGVFFISGTPWELLNWNVAMGAPNGEEIEEG